MAIDQNQTQTTPDPFARPNIDWNDPTARQNAINQGYQAAYGKSPDMSYWDPKFQKDPNYFWDRLLGKGAGKADQASSGPYANGNGYTPERPSMPPISMMMGMSPIDTSSNFNQGQNFQPLGQGQGIDQNLFNQLLQRATSNSTPRF